MMMKKSVDLQSALSTPKQRIAEQIARLPKSGIREFFDLVSGAKDIISLGVGEPDFVTPWTIRESAIYSLEKGHTTYTSNYGLLALRRAICNYVSRDYGVEYNPEHECLVTVGVSEALDLAVRAILNPGDEVIYTEPCFVSYPAEIAMAHGVPVPIATYEKNAFALDPADLRRKITPKTKAVLINFPCNPTGAVLSMEQMQEIAGIVIENDLILLTDEIYSELSYTGRLPSIASLPGMKDRTIFLHGFSKAFAMTGFRIGYACGPADLIDAMMKIHQYGMMCASITSQEAALEALANAGEDMEKMRLSYEERRNMLVAGLNKIGLPCLLPNGAFYAFPRITETGLDSHTFAKRLLLEHKVAVVPGNAFGASGEGYVRCCYATAASDIRIALDRMEEFVNKVKKEQR